MLDQLRRVCRAFRMGEELLSYEELTAGNINRTYKVNMQTSNGREKAYVVQSLNTYVFKNPVWVMENIDRVTAHLRAKQGDRATLRFYHTAEGKAYVFEGEEFWRLCDYIAADTFRETKDREIVRNAGAAFGEFQMLLADFDAAKLAEIIPDFHNTRKRYEKLKQHAQEDPCGKAAAVRAELEWLLSVEERACELTDLFAAGRLPLRVTHNDTKISNVLFDKEDKSALAVIDLDTVMPGLVGSDFGDAIRSAASVAGEDCSRPEQAGLDLNVFEAFAEGFLQHTAKILTAEELQSLPLSCFALTAELVVRFLDDYLLDSPYFKICYPEHNLVRARGQIALAKDMLSKMDAMERIIAACASRYA